MSVNLNEFSEDVLQYAIGIFIEAQDDCNRKISLIESWEEGSIKNSIYNELSFKLDSAILFRVQLENALKEVQAKEKVNNC